MTITTLIVVGLIVYGLAFLVLAAWQERTP